MMPPGGFRRIDRRLGLSRHRVGVMGEENAILPRCPLQHCRVVGSRQSGDVLDPDYVKVGVSPPRPAQDDVVEVFVGGQTQHAVPRS
jgi:hypothetical protein